MKELFMTNEHFGGWTFRAWIGWPLLFLIFLAPGVLALGLFFGIAYGLILVGAPQPMAVIAAALFLVASIVIAPFIWMGLM